VATSAFVEWDVTPLVSGNGAISFVLMQPGTDGVDLRSRESGTVSQHPQLVVTTGP
jgi:hypothetical protein